MKNILVAYERSGKVRDAFIARGHNAISCDLVDTLQPGPHYRGNVWDIVDGPWDMLIAFPPCTYVATVGVRWNVNNPERQHKMKLAAKNFECLWRLPIKQKAIENPIGVIPKYTGINYSQIIQPWYFGDPYNKPTCLWLDNLPLLKPTDIVSRGEITVTPHGKHNTSKWFSNNKKMRDITFNGVANAMAMQWL